MHSDALLASLPVDDIYIPSTAWTRCSSCAPILTWLLFLSDGSTFWREAVIITNLIFTTELLHVVTTTCIDPLLLLKYLLFIRVVASVPFPLISAAIHHAADLLLAACDSIIPLLFHFLVQFMERT